jgi:group II intron reverse transcriptase/maturase
LADIEAQGVEQWLGNLQQELRTNQYRPQSLLRVWIPKASGGQRALGIPTVRDRVVQTAVMLVINPVFEPDLLPQQYGFRPRLDAKMALRRVYFHVTQGGRTEVVDADLSDYFNAIPHGPLMKCVARRVCDRQVLSVIKAWLRVAVAERHGTRLLYENPGKRTKRGTPQGGVISPLLANLYFSRFLLAWRRLGAARETGGTIVNYADDLVICCRPGNGEAAMHRMRQLMKGLGLTVNEKKTGLVRLPDERLDFLGYTVGRFYGHNGRAFIGTAPSRKSIQRVCRKIRAETSRRWLTKTAESRVREINRILRGWSNYFNQGPVTRSYMIVQEATTRFLRRWLVRKHRIHGGGYRQYPNDFLHKKLGLHQLVVFSGSPPSAKV